MFSPYLIQRLSIRYNYKDPNEDPLTSRSVDAYFTCDYMGSAEFEFGALPGNLKLWRAAKDITIQELSVRLGDTKFYIVAPQATINAYLGDIETWWKAECTGKRTHRLKEPTNITRFGTDTLNDRFDGWWCVDFGDRHSPEVENPWLFAIFKDPQHAKIWHHCVTSKK